MPTVRSYLHRTLRLAFNVVFLILACCLIFFFLGWVLPSTIANGLLIITIEKIKLIFLFLITLPFFFLLFTLYKASRTEKSFGKELLKMTPAIFIWLLPVFFLAYNIAELSNQTDCKNYNYNEKLNGGIKEFNGEKYALNICGSGVNGSHFFGGPYDSVVLFITDEQGRLRAKRHYKVFWDGQPGHAPIAIGKESIIYQDDESQTEHAIKMPPGRMEWIRARIPLIN